MEFLLRNILIYNINVLVFISMQSCMWDLYDCLLDIRNWPVRAEVPSAYSNHEVALPQRQTSTTWQQCGKL